METAKKRVYTLYRVSTVGQVDKNDIPLQKIRCREFAEQQGWEIIREVSELGVSGFKVSAKDRDAIVDIQQDAALGKFDILLVFMFDRLGRRDDETPFVVEWFVNNGVEVWSAEEGQQRFDSHVDKLMNYIRYWQASGESLKTSIRTKTRLQQIVQEGHYRGGTPPYGYRLEKQGRMNKKNRELYEIIIDESEADIVRCIFDKYINEGYGAQRLSRYLLEKGVRNRKGDNFANTTLIKMLKNDFYTGVMTCGEIKTGIYPELQIIDPDTYARAQEIMTSRTKEHSGVPLNTKGKALLAGFVYCGHCGSKLVLTTSGSLKRPSGRKIRYGCHNRVRHPQSCDGQAGYGVTKLDGLVETAIKALFAQIKAVPQEQLLETQYVRQVRMGEKALASANERCKDKERELQIYKSEIRKVIDGSSVWSMDILNEMILETKDQIASAKTDIQKAQAEIDGYEHLAAEVKNDYSKVLSWSDLFDSCTMEAKKMIAAQLIKQVRVDKDYNLEIDLNVSYEKFVNAAESEQPLAKKEKMPA